MHFFLKDLSTEVFFCASCAGFKDDLHQFPRMSDKLTILHHVQAELEKLKDIALSSFYSNVLGDKNGKSLRKMAAPISILIYPLYSVLFKDLVLPSF